MSNFKEKIKKMWEKITESKINISMFVAGCIAFVLLIAVMFVALFRDKGLQGGEVLENTGGNTGESKQETTVSNETKEEETQEYSTSIDESETKNIVNNSTKLSVRLNVSNSWTGDGEKFIEYKLTVTNISGKEIDGWAIVADMDKSFELVDSWTFTFKEGKRRLVINPTYDNKKLEEGESVSGGFIVKAPSNVFVDYFTLYAGNVIETVYNGMHYVPETQKPTSGERETESETDAQSETDDETSGETDKHPETGDETESEAVSTTADDEKESETTTPSETAETTTPPETDEPDEGEGDTAGNH